MNITLNSLIDDLQQIKTQAMENGQTAAAINAVALQAKLLGLDSGKHLESKPQPVQVIVDVKDARKR